MKKIFTVFLFAYFFVPLAYSGERSVLSGTWNGYYVLKENIIKQLGIKYIFCEDGSWSIQKGDKKIEKQGWYKFDKNMLLLQLAESAKKNENTAIPAILKNNNSFEIRNPIDNESKLFFCKSSEIKNITPDMLAGKWQMKYRDLDKNEITKADFFLVFDTAGNYTIEFPTEKYQQNISAGTYQLSGSLLFLENKSREERQSQPATFFLFEGKLIFNNNLYSIWCEKITASPQGDVADSIVTAE